MIYTFHGHTPDTQRAAFVADTATLLGDVVLEEGSSIWYGAVLRGDEGRIVIGKNTNIQDCSVLHTFPGGELRLGQGVTVGHGAIVHGCTVGDNCLIGMGATLLNRSVIGEGSIIAAGALVTEDKVIPPYSLVMGVPGKVVRTLEGEQRNKPLKNAEMYVQYAAEHAALQKEQK